MNQVVDVTNFGVIADGVTDNTETFQAAINHAKLNGLNIYAPQGVYKISSVLDI